MDAAIAHDVAQRELADWHPSAPWSVGVEEEAMLLDPRDWALADRIEAVLAALPAELAPWVRSETHQAVVELATAPHATVAATAAQLRALRRRLARALPAAGVVAAAAGLHPFSSRPITPITARRRHLAVDGTMRALARREPTYALHVHVGVPDPERAVAIMNRLRAHLPLLLALSGSSPYWQGRDSGFCSARTFLFGAFPRTGIPRRFSSYEEWAGVVELLVRSEALPEPTFLWWDVRLQPRFGTVEVRIMDAQASVEDTAALCALVQSVAALESHEGFADEELLGAQEVLEENRFLAARDGMDARLVDPRRVVRRGAREQLEELVQAARPYADALGCAAQLDAVLRLAAAPGAVRQRRLVRAGCGLTGVVAALAREYDALEG